MLCPLFLIEVTLAMQLAGLFPTFDLMYMYSLVHPTNSLHQILVGFHSTLFFFGYLLYLSSTHLFHVYRSLCPSYLLSNTFSRTIKKSVRNLRK